MMRLGRSCQNLLLTESSLQIYCALVCSFTLPWRARSGQQYNPCRLNGNRVLAHPAINPAVVLSGQSTALYCSLPLADGLSHIDMDCAGLSGEQLGVHHPAMAAASGGRPSKQCWLEGAPDAPLWIQPGRLCCSAPRSTLQVIIAQLVNVFTWLHHRQL